MFYKQEYIFIYILIPCIQFYRSYWNYYLFIKFQFTIFNYNFLNFSFEFFKISFELICYYVFLLISKIVPQNIKLFHKT